MTLFIQTPKRLLEISDAYVMALAFLISFSVTKVLKAFFEKQKKYNAKHIMMPNPVGGEVNVQITDDSELSKTILSCIADNNRLVFSIYYSGGWNDYFINFGQTVPVGEWHHFAVSYDYHGKQIIGWRDGELIAVVDLTEVDTEPLKQNGFSFLPTPFPGLVHSLCFPQLFFAP